MSQLLEEWDLIKEQMNQLKKRENEIKNQILRIMDQHNTDTLKNSKFTCTRKSLVRESICKKSVPSDIWSMYATEIEYQTLSLRNDLNKPQRSPRRCPR